MNTRKELNELISSLSLDELEVLKKLVDKVLKHAGRKPPNAENLKNAVLAHTPFVRLDGRLCFFNGTHFSPIKSQSQIEALIYSLFPGILESVPMKTIKDCAYILYSLHKFEDYEPDEVNCYLGFNNGIYKYTSIYGLPHSFVDYRYIPGYRGYTPSVYQDYMPTENETPSHPLTLDKIYPEGWLEKYNASFHQANSAFDLLPEKIHQVTQTLFDSDTPAQQERFPIRITHALNVDFIDCAYEMTWNGELVNEYQLQGAYESDLPRPKQTDKFFREIAGGNSDIFDRIWEVIACILVPDPKVKHFFLLQGRSDTGKSVLGNFIKSFFHEENVSALDFTRLGDKYSSSTLPGTYLNMSMDLPNRTISLNSIATLKMLTGDDSVTVEPKFENVASYRNRCRFVFASNYNIKLHEYDEAFINRLVLIPFINPPEKKDPNLLEALKAEKNLVAAWAIQEYYPRIKQKNFVFSGVEDPELTPVVHYPQNYRETQLLQIRDFAMSHCKVTGNDADYVVTEDLRNGYQAFCNQNGYPNTCDMRQFTTLFKEALGDAVYSSRKRTQDRNQSCCFGLKYYADPMTIYE